MAIKKRILIPIYTAVRSSIVLNVIGMLQVEIYGV